MKIIKTVNFIPVRDNKTQICLVRRVFEGHIHGKWSFPGQSLKKGDVAKNAVNKIIKDEMNCDVSNVTFLKKSEFKTKNAVIKSEYFFGNIKGNIKIDERKYVEFKWFNIDEELFFLDFAFDQKDIVTDFLKVFIK